MNFLWKTFVSSFCIASIYEYLLQGKKVNLDSGFVSIWAFKIVFNCDGHMGQMVKYNVEIQVREYLKHSLLCCPRDFRSDLHHSPENCRTGASEFYFSCN